MLTSNGLPPQFRLPDNRGRETALADFLGRRRIVLAFNPDAACLDALAVSRDGLDERDIVVLVVLPPTRPSSPTLTAPPFLVLIDEGSRVADAYGVPADGPFFCLIGKDGTIKQAGPNLPTPAALFGAVDAMPMRRQEMRERNRQGCG